MGMRKRLQVLLNEREYEELERAARRSGLSMSQWVRDAICARLRTQPSAEEETKLVAVRAAVRHEFPTADIDEMLAEIERGYLGPSNSSRASRVFGSRSSSP